MLPLLLCLFFAVEVDQSLGALVLAARRGELLIQTKHTVQHFQLHASLGGFLPDDLHVLDEVLHKEAGGEVAGQRTGGHVGNLPAARCAAADGRQHLVGVQPGLLGIEDGLGVGRGRARHGDLVGRLGVLAVARGAHQQHALAHALKQGQSFFKGFLVAAHHDGQGGFPGAFVAAGDRGIHHGDALLLAQRIQLLGERGAGGGHIHHHRAGGGVLQNALGAAEHLLHVCRVAHHHEHEFRVGNRLADGGAGGKAEFLGLLAHRRS